ncbi:MAG: riboflavin synthase, partial [Myxococcota bacterium]
MFTGIVESVGVVLSAEPQGDGRRFRVRCADVVEGVRLGDSIAFNGTCLTVTELQGDEISFDAVRETIDCTGLGDVTAGERINLERAMRADARLDGHIVQGHVDGVGKVVELKRRDDDVELHIDCSEDVAGLLVDKGSVTVQGVSLTVVAVSDAGFYVALIPHT